MPYVYALDRLLVSRLLPALAALLLLLGAGPAHAQIAPGVYPVGPDGDYETLEAALDDVQMEGIDDSGTGAVELALMPGTFEEGGLTLGPVAGSSADRPLVIRSQENDASTVTLQHTATEASGNFIVRLDSAQHVRLEALTWAPQNPDSARAVALSGTTADLEITGNVFEGVGTESFGDFRDNRFALITVHDDNWAPEDAVRIADNTFNQGTYGVLMDFTVADDAFPSVEATGNTFDNQRVAGIKVEEATGALVDGNTVTIEAGDAANDGFGIEIRETDAPQVIGNAVDVQADGPGNRTGVVVDGSPNAQITGNAVTVEGIGDEAAFDGRGIDVRGFGELSPQIEDNVVEVSGTFFDQVGISCGCEGAARVLGNRVMVSQDTPDDFPSAWSLVVGGTGSGDGGLIANNQLILNAAQDEFGVQAVRINGANQRFYHNSVRFELASGVDESAALSTDNTVSDVDVKNNVLAVPLGGLALDVEDPSGVTSDYNDLYVAGPTLARWGGTEIATLDDLQAMGSDASSTDVYPAFVSYMNLSTRSYYLDDEGADLTATVPEDIDGTPRAAPPSMGAYQINDPIMPFAPGTYTVGSSGDFPSPDSALTALLSGGIEPPTSTDDSAEVEIALEPGTYDGTNYVVHRVPGASAQRRVALASTSGDSSDTVIEYAASSAADDYVLRLPKTDHVTVRDLTLRADGADFSKVVRAEGATDSLRVEGSQLQSVGGVDGVPAFQDDARGAAFAATTTTGPFEVEIDSSWLGTVNGDVALAVDVTIASPMSTASAPTAPTAVRTGDYYDPPGMRLANTDILSENGQGADVRYGNAAGDAAGHVTLKGTDIDADGDALVADGLNQLTMENSHLFSGFGEAARLTEFAVAVLVQTILISPFGISLSGADGALTTLSNILVQIQGNSSAPNGKAAASARERRAKVQIQGDADISWTTFALPGTPLGLQVTDRSLTVTNSLADGLSGLNLGLSGIPSIDLSGSVADVPSGLEVTLNGTTMSAEEVLTNNGGTVADVTLNEEGQAAKSTALTVDNPDPGTLLDVNGNVREDVDPTTPGSQTPVGAFGTFLDGEIPVELTAFTARSDGRAAVLSWRTASETNNAGFRVERRTDDTDPWTRMGFVESQAEGGTSAQPLSYRFRTEGLDVGAHAFRLVQTDLDGSTTPSDPVEVRIGLDEAFALSTASPNPIRGRGTVEVAVREAQEVTAHLYDVLGRRVRVLHDGPLAEQTTHRLAVDARGLSSGIYFVRVVGETFAANRKVVVVR